MTDPTFNLLMLERVGPSWYDHLPQVEAAMADDARITHIRTAANLSCDEGGWYSPCGTHESEWELNGHPFPEDPDYDEWASAYWHYEALDVQTLTP